MIKNNQKGFTLVEQLITLALGALLMAGIATSVSAITRAQNLTQDYGNLQESLGFITSTQRRSARHAEAVKTGSNNKLLSFEIKPSSGKEIKSCLAKGMQQNFTETYSLVDNNLVCEVEHAAGGSTIQSEVIAFGVKNLSFECAEYKEEVEVEFKACEETTLGKVIAVRAEITLDKKEFLEIEKDFNYSTTVYMRLKHNNLIDP